MNIDAQISASNALMLEKMMTTPKEAFVPRPDGRAVDALRPVEITRRFTKYAEGSVLMCAGDTHVLCTASVTVGVPNFLRGKGEGWVTAEYGLLPRSTGTRTDREAARGKQTGRTQEIQRLIGRSLRAVVDRKKLGEHTIQIDCDVLQADGGTDYRRLDCPSRCRGLDARQGHDLRRSNPRTGERGIRRHVVRRTGAGLELR